MCETQNQTIERKRYSSINNEEPIGQDIFLPPLHKKNLEIAQSKQNNLALKPSSAEPVPNPNSPSIMPIPSPSPIDLLTLGQ